MFWMTVSGISVYLTSFHALVVQGVPDPFKDKKS